MHVGVLATVDEADCDLSISKCMLQNLEDEECFPPNVGEFGQHCTMFRVCLSACACNNSHFWCCTHWTSNFF